MSGRRGTTCNEIALLFAAIVAVAVQVEQECRDPSCNTPPENEPAVAQRATMLE